VAQITAPALISIVSSFMSRSIAPYLQAA